MRQLLRLPQLYQGFQNIFGFSDVRRKAIEQYLNVKPGAKVLDVGCGPGRILTYLPENIEYHGFDISQEYIDHANETYGHRGTFYCREFNEDVLEEFSGADFVMLNGVLHHLDDELSHSILSVAAKALNSTGVLFTLDGVYHEKQNLIAKKLKDMDRGEYVRDEAGYKALVDPYFSKLDIFIRKDISPLPYTFIFMRATP